MIIRWDDADLSDIIEIPGFSSVVADLLYVNRHGFHLVVLSRELARKLGELNLSGADKAMLARLESEYSQTGALYRSAPLYIEIINVAEERIERQGSSVRISVGAIRKTRILDRPVLLSENAMTDGWFYECSMRSVGTQTGKGSLYLDRAHGGGDDVVAVFQDLLERKRIVFVIVDSDRNSPLAKANIKLSRCRTVINRTGWPLGVAASPPCREVENIVPLNVVADLDSAIGAEQFLDVLRQIEESEAKAKVPLQDRLQLFVDLKEGVSAEKVGKMGEEDRRWITGKIARYMPREVDWKIPGFGEKIINQICADGEHIASLREQCRKKEWMNVFSEFFEDVAWFFISHRPIVT